MATIFPPVLAPPHPITIGEKKYRFPLDNVLVVMTTDRYSAS